MNTAILNCQRIQQLKTKHTKTISAVFLVAQRFLVMKIGRQKMQILPSSFPLL